jgi:RNA repair pathway DNA polymerase beta family
VSTRFNVHAGGDGDPRSKGAAPRIRPPARLRAGTTHRETGTVLRVQVGSGVHGTSISGQDDRDEMGICFEPHEYLTGLARVPTGASDTRTIPFEQPSRASRAHLRAE